MNLSPEQRKIIEPYLSMKDFKSRAKGLVACGVSFEEILKGLKK